VPVNRRRLFFWGAYLRQILPDSETIRIQRIRCSTCLKTHALLPSFLFGQVRYTVETVSVYAQQAQHKSLAQVWQQTRGDNPADLGTVYCWFRRLRQSLTKLLPLLKKELLSLSPEFDLAALEEVTLTQKVKPSSLNEQKATLDPLPLCLWLSRELLSVADELIGLRSDLSPLAFLNYFCWQKLKTTLLSPPANPPPE
jgi:hypothetical protein